MALIGGIIAVLSVSCTNETEAVETRPCQATIDDQLADLAERGKLKGVAISIDDSKQDVEKIYGEPDETGVYSTPYVKYDDCVIFMFETVSAIWAGSEVSQARVKELLGDPSFEGYNEEGDQYMISYRVGEYQLTFNYFDQSSDAGYVAFKKM